VDVSIFPPFPCYSSLLRPAGDALLETPVVAFSLGLQHSAVTVLAPLFRPIVLTSFLSSCFYVSPSFRFNPPRCPCPLGRCDLVVPEFLFLPFFGGLSALSLATLAGQYDALPPSLICCYRLLISLEWVVALHLPPAVSVLFFPLSITFFEPNRDCFSFLRREGLRVRSLSHGTLVISVPTVGLQLLSRVNAPALPQLVSSQSVMDARFAETCFPPPYP